MYSSNSQGQRGKYDTYILNVFQQFTRTKRDLLQKRFSQPF
jgi:hypothetical protein